MLTDDVDGETGDSTWSGGADRGMSIEGSFRLDPLVKVGTQLQIRIILIGELFSLGYDTIPIIEVGRRIFNRS